MADSEGDDKVKFVADLLVRKLYRRINVRAAASNEFSLVAGALWAAQAQESAVEFRLNIPVEVTPTESVIWAFALMDLCTLINAIHGDGVAEDLMYRIEELERIPPKNLNGIECGAEQK